MSGELTVHRATVSDGPTLVETMPCPAPTRPRNDDELPFTRKRPVRWFTPRVLASASQRVMLASALGDFLDKRELQAGLPDGVVDLSRTRGPDTWIDYVADAGDGFDATYSIAWLTAQRELDVDGLAEPLPRPGLLVLGGDEVYPTPSPTEYEDRFKGPYRAALPHVPADNPKIVAIPGNHDWYDGLTNFTRLFCTADSRWIGGRTADQTRSYFAVRLPHDWWLWGIDIQLGSYIDDPQLRYFTKVAAQMGPGARLVLCTAEPSWTDVGSNPDAFRNLAFLESQVIRPAGLHLMLSISGDSHHYAHYFSDVGTHRITAGGGGAFLHPTHHLDDALDVPTDPIGDDVQRYHRGPTYPDASTSRGLSAGALRLPRTNPQFMLVPALIYLILGWASQAANRLTSDRQADALGDAVQRLGWFDHLVGMARSPVAILVLLLVFSGLVGFAKPATRWSHGPRKLVAKTLMGASHLAAQLAVGGIVGSIAVDVASVADGRLHFVLLAAVVGVLGGLAGTLVMGAYLAVCCAFLRAHGNEAFSAMGLTDYKNFLRLRIDEAGRLIVYAIGLNRANHDWSYASDATAPDASWLTPAAGTLSPKLIEDPIIITPPGLGPERRQEDR